MISKSWRCIVILLFVGLFMLGGCSLFRTEWAIRYEIVNNAGLEDYGGFGVDYRQTFVVRGTIELKNVKSDLYIIQADALGANGNTTAIFTTVSVDGDGTYAFNMTSFYWSPGFIIDVINIQVEEP